MQPCPLTGDQTKTKREHMLGELLGMAAKTENGHNQEVLVVLNEHPGHMTPSLNSVYTVQYRSQV